MGARYPHTHRSLLTRSATARAVVAVRRLRRPFLPCGGPGSAWAAWSKEVVPQVLRKLPGAEVDNIVATRPETSVVWRPTVVKTPAIVVIVVWLWRLISGTIKTLVRHPVACAVTGSAGALWYLAGWRALVAAYVTFGLGSACWALADAASYGRWVGWPLVSWARWMWVYRRRWRAVLVGAGLGGSFWGRAYVPDVRRVRSTRLADRVTVKMLAGQSDELWADRSPNLAHGFGAVSCRVSVIRPGWLLLSFPRADLLAVTITARPIPRRPVVGAVEIGLDEEGRPFRLKIHGTHVLVAGATGAGKGSWLWSVVRALLPAQEAGLVQLWGLDPKLMELSFGQQLFTRYAATPEQCAELLELAVTWMQERAGRYAGVQRSHTPTTDDPFVLVIVDEVAFLTAYQADRQLKARILAALSTLTTQGRAAGFAVMALLQDPRKDVLAIRNLFPDRVALRLDEPEQVDMVLGDGARDRGALADQIPRDPDDPAVGAGIGYVRLENSPDPVRVRAAYVSDGDIRQMVARYCVPMDKRGGRDDDGDGEEDGGCGGGQPDGTDGGTGEEGGEMDGGKRNGRRKAGDEEGGGAL
ncbi:FtsK/SpoIIIE domain-containing protein [Nonomuraea sp. NPDC004354]